MWTEFPKVDEVNRAKFERERELAPAHLNYVMFFTPRSGSSWVTDIASKSGQLGLPGENFNPNFLPSMTRAMNATTLDEYCEILVRRRQTGGVFGSQITYHQLNAVFESEESFITRFPEKKCFWLIREDIVLQGISLLKMQQTDIAHAVQTDADELARKESAFVYDVEQIMLWINHIRVAEQKTEAMFRSFGLKPFRMSYERNTELRPTRLVNVMSAYLGLPRMKWLHHESQHRKIATDKNQKYAERFRAEQPEFVAALDEDRRPMLAALREYRRPVSSASQP